jgi:uncharacterized protein YndB with AHSA1/START domain
MSVPKIVHGSFVIERTYDAPPARAFAAWADPAVKGRWFIGPDGWTTIERRLVFRVGGEERLHGRLAGGAETLFTARYHEIVPDRRIVYVYDMHYDRTFLSVSLATVEFAAAHGGTRLTFSEQAAYLDGKDGTAARERGTAAHLDRIAAALRTP